ncbi:unnamed protein product [Owenia fusiformis]|uniref:TGF-beta-activated kinase 1 and MAP3K7-binding protein 1 n=1 Tax=Owenia fusiformis TaxID=6347 RepID=A0A8J1XZK1_OWEFU|nr:unnamed protein product [Owenia fusiformis]
MASLTPQIAGSPPARINSQSSTYALSWTDDLPVCHESGVGFSTNQIYREDGHRVEEHAFEDRSFHFSLENGCDLYGVFDGHDGVRAADFATQRMPAELLLGQLEGKTDENEIREIVRQAFISVEKGYFETLDEALAEKAHLEGQIPEGITPQDIAGEQPELANKLQALTDQIHGGTTAVLALIHNKKLYVANVGDSRALLCKEDKDGRLRVKQLSVDHTVDNQNELQRLADLGLDVEKIRQNRLIGKMEYTRSIGDYPVKGGYKEIELLSGASSEPVIEEPDILQDAISLEDSRGFLLLMSDGLYKSLQDATGRPRVNAEITSLVAREFGIQTTLNGIAQSVVDKVVRIHHDAFMTGTPNQKSKTQKRDDMTLLVRNFNYPLQAIGSPTYLPASMPYQGRTNTNEPLHLTIGDREPPSVNRSLFMRTNGTTISSTLTGTNYTNNSTSSNEDSNRGSGEQRFFSKKRSLPLDEKGEIEGYVDFGNYFSALEAMDPTEREQFEEEVKVRPNYEPIKEEPERSESIEEADGSGGAPVPDTGFAEEPKTPDDEIAAPLTTTKIEP